MGSIIHDYEPIDWNSPNKYSALSGDDDLGDLPGDNPARDSYLKLLIIEELRSAEISCLKLDIHVKDGFVSLTGQVESEQVKRSIIDLIENIDGVVDVASYLSGPIPDDADNVPSPS